MTTINNIGSKLEELVNDYVEELKPKLEKKLDETAFNIIKYISNTAPRSGKSGSIADSFIAEPKGKGINKTIIIYSKTKGGLTHLLEFGFTHRSGKFVRGRPFMRPAYERFTPKMLEDIKEIIEKGKPE